VGVNLLHTSFDANREKVIADAQSVGVSPLIITGSSIADSKKARDYAAGTAGKCYATVGIHPHNAKTYTSSAIKILREMARFPEVGAIGECGLDYNRNFSPPAMQRECFEGHIALAAELQLPLFLHERDAFDDFYAALVRNRTKITRMVVHCFTGTAEQLSYYLDLGCYIGITGWVCDERRGMHLAPLLKTIPRDRLLLETDAPFLVPRTLPEKPRYNEPKYLPHIASAVAAILKTDAETVAAETFRNSLAFFGIDEKRTV
jgi:TatD DNase family protein